MTSRAALVLEGWARRLVGRPFRWGVTDCGTLAVEAWRLRHQLAPFPVTIPPYTTRAEALAAWRAVGGIRAALEQAGGHPIARSAVVTGDYVVSRDGHHCAIVIGDALFGVSQEHGVVLDRVAVRVVDDAVLLRVP